MHQTESSSVLLMRPYCTVHQLAQLATNGWAELAQRAGKDVRLSGAALRAAADGEALPPEEQAKAEAALAVLTDVIERTSARVDGYLSPRYREIMPLDQDLIDTSGLQDAVAMLSLLALYGSATTEEMRKSAAWAHKYLDDLSTGKASLGGGDAVTKTPGKIYVRSGQREMV